MNGHGWLSSAEFLQFYLDRAEALQLSVMHPLAIAVLVV